MTPPKIFKKAFVVRPVTWTFLECRIDHVRDKKAALCGHKNADHQNQSGNTARHFCARPFAVPNAVKSFGDRDRSRSHEGGSNQLRSRLPMAHAPRNTRGALPRLRHPASSSPTTSRARRPKRLRVPAQRSGGKQTTSGRILSEKTNAPRPQPIQRRR